MNSCVFLNQPKPHFINGLLIKRKHWSIDAVFHKMAYRKNALLQALDPNFLFKIFTS